MPVQFVTASSQVRACDLGQVTVLLDARSGRVDVLLGPGRELWSALAGCGDAAEAARRVPRLEPTSAHRLVDDLVAADLLAAATQPRPWPVPVSGVPTQPSWGTQELAAQLDPPAPAPWRDRGLAAAAVAFTLGARQCGRAETRFPRLLRLVERTAARGQRPGSPEEVRHAVSAVRRVACLFPARVACLEESIATVLVLAATSRRVIWCHGVAGDPVRFHAWVQTEHGGRVEEPSDIDRYTPLIQIPRGGPRGDDDDQQ